jgi:uncharacterized protein RhaS with RHS repeats
VGRFLQEDPTQFSGGNVNLYGYVGNSPTIFIDPTGKNPCLLAGLVAANGYLAYQVYAELAGRKSSFEAGLSGAVHGLSSTLDFAGGVAGVCAAFEGGGIGSYKNLRELTAGFDGDFQAHHILEVRHLRNWGYAADAIDDAPAIILDRTEHTALTNALSEALPYGEAYTRAEVWEVYQDIYAAYPDWLDAISGYFQ